MIALLVLAVVLVLTTIVVSLVTAADLGRQRAALAALDHELLEVEGRLEQIAAQRRTVGGTLDLHRALREEKSRRIKDLLDELERLKEERVEEREIKVASGLRQRSAADASPQEE